uniref:Uncharacterized protein n=1 Tax=Panagrolaimus sp. ES5 TaxID=591445 RepID=A0AC34GUG0_9BILA
MQGFNKTASVFEEELRSEVGLQDSVEKLVFQIFQYIEDYCPEKLLELWRFLNERMFATLSESQLKVASDLENTTYKLYLINCIKNDNIPKAHEFFSRIADLTRNNPDWNDWFCLPYIKNPGKEKTFEKYFLPHWQACLIVWLHNFLSAAFANISKSRLTTYIENGKTGRQTSGDVQIVASSAVTFEAGLTDDFAVIAQVGTPGSKTSSKSLKTIFKNIAGK